MTSQKTSTSSKDSIPTKDERPKESENSHDSLKESNIPVNSTSSKLPEVSQPNENSSNNSQEEVEEPTQGELY